MRRHFFIHLPPVIQTLDSAIHWINHYPLDNSIGFASVYPLDSDLSGGQRYPSFEQLGPDLVNTKTTIPLRVGEEWWICTSTLRVSAYIHHYSPPLRGIVVYYSLPGFSESVLVIMQTNLSNGGVPRPFSLAIVIT